MRERKIIQVAIGLSGICFLVVLCDDGTIWERSLINSDNKDWKKIQDVPQY